MDDLSGESDVGLTIDESDSASRQNNRKKTRKNAGTKGTRKNKTTFVNNKPKLKIKLPLPVAEKLEIKNTNVRVSTRIRKPRNLSPPVQELKLKIKKPTKTTTRTRKIKTKSSKKQKPKHAKNENSDFIETVDIENVSEDENFISIPAQTPVIIPDKEPLPQTEKVKKPALKIRLSLGKVLKEASNVTEEKMLESEIFEEKHSGTGSGIDLLDSETRLVQPLKIKRAIPVPSLEKQNISKQFPKLTVKTDHEPLTMKFSAGKVEFVEAEIEKPSSNLRWTVSPQTEVKSNVNSPEDERKPNKHPFSEVPSLTTNSPAKYHKSASPVMAVHHSPSKLSPLSTSILSSSSLIPTKNATDNQNILFNPRFQSLLDTVTAELQEQKKIEASSKNVDINDLNVHSDLPTVEFPKQELKFGAHKRPRKKSSATSASLLKIKENVDVLEATDLSHIESKELNEMPEKKRRKLIKRKELADDYLDPDEVPSCIPDVKQSKLSSRREHDPTIDIKISNKQHFNTLLMPSQWADEEKVDTKSKLTKSLTSTVDKKSSYKMPRTKKGMATTKQRLASKLKLSTKRGFTY